MNQVCESSQRFEGYQGSLNHTANECSGKHQWQASPPLLLRKARSTCSRSVARTARSHLFNKATCRLARAARCIFGHLARPGAYGFTMPVELYPASKALIGAGDILLVQTKAHSRRRGGHRLHCCAGAANGKPKGPVIVVDNYDSFTYNLCQVNRASCLSPTGADHGRRSMRGLTCMCLLRCSILAIWAASTSC